MWNWASDRMPLGATALKEASYNPRASGEYTLRGLSVLFAIAVLLLPVPASSVSASARAEEPSLRQMVGQMLMVGFTGGSLEADGYRTIHQQAFEGRIGGVLFLGRNIRSLDRVRQMNEALQSVSRTPLLIAVDQEGGRIERLTRGVGFREIPSAASVSETLAPDAAREVYEDLAGRLASLGFNLNLGPVVDLNINPDNPIIGRLGRSYSDDPKRVEAYAKAFVDGHRVRGVLTSLKHFPGHGSSVDDTHYGSADVTNTWRENELLPYAGLIATGHADMIMSSHVVNARLSGEERLPASLSANILNDLLRGALRFDGVVITDDLQMGAVNDGRGLDDTVRVAVLAGNDILVFANDKAPDPQLPEKVAAVLIREAQRNPDMLQRIRMSYVNIMRLKSRL